MFEFKPSTLKQYRRDRARKGSSDFEYYYIENGYVYIPDSEVRVIEGEVITLDLYDLEQMSSCGEPECKSAWEVGS